MLIPQAMISIKSEKEIRIMQQGGEILKKVLRGILKHTSPGVILLELDRLAEKLILSHGAKPSFKMEDGYKWSICACVNDVVVHGIPNDYTLKTGDVVGLDCGIYYEGFHTDSAWTIRTKNKHDDVDRFLSVGERALSEAIGEVKVGNYIYDISNAIQKRVEGAGFSVVRTLVGHGIGRQLHEEPEVPCFVRQERDKTAEIVLGMTLAIEVIYNIGSPQVVYKGNDGWTIATRDGKISGLFESTVAVTPHGVIVLT